METLYIVMPAYNEEMNIEKVIKDWYPKLDGKSLDSRIVIADYGSKDSTHDIIMRLKKSDYPQVEVLKNSNQFHGPKLIDLYDYSIRNGADWIFQTDSDGQTNPDEFDIFWKQRNDYVGMFGNRTNRGDGKGRAFVEKVVCFLLRLYFGVKVPDANAPFRLMKASVLEKYLYRLPRDYNIPNIMIVAFFSLYGEKIIFNKITFKPRLGGVNSIDVHKIVKIGIKALGDFYKLKKQCDCVI